ncbi:hypothetical protein RRF57_007915 [Xylaria bambusicola]|uniref:Heterokaryon incompatibility domain-containing protein n=1 Tax=Xylaria bambusicola TaxID=326684 RepID=A0AAN7UUF2_9PEZI
MVVVAAVKSAHSGLPGRGSLRRQQFRPTEIIEGITFTIGAPSPQDQLISTTWNRRGWTYQEAELARRVLVIAESQVYWSCREENWCEDRFTEFLVPTISSSVFNSRLTTQTSPLRSRSLFSPTIGLCYLGEYGYKVKEFSDRSFSDPKDMLWAFLGILKSLLPLFPEGYIWGMPRARLDATLLWQTDNKSRLSDPLAILTKKGRWQELTIPSWCWIGKGAKVWYEECYESVESMLDWREPVDMEEHGLLNGNPEAERGKEWASDIQSTIFQSSHSFSGDTIFDYALLHFAAESATLRLHTPTWGVNRVHTCCSFVSATISLLSGKDIGSVKVPLSAFCDENTLSRREIEGEFILLSSISRRNEDGTKISEEPRYNIMLLSWSKDKKIAYRVSWTDIAKSAWDECETQKKTIILG